jgi:hypothetical protein
MEQDTAGGAMKYERLKPMQYKRVAFRLAQFTEPFVFSFNGTLFVIPKGFWIDGLSVPTLSLWYVQPFMKWAIEAGGVHDFFYRCYRMQSAKLWDDGEYRILTRAVIDRLFLHMLLEGIREYIPDDAILRRTRRARLVAKAKVMYRAVRAGGGFAIGDGFGDMPKSLKRSIDRAGYKL